MKHLKIALALCVFLSTPVASASFGEIDLIVRESVENHFRDYGFSVDMRRFDYRGELEVIGDRMIVRSSVWAEQRQIKPYWGWHYCTTKILIKARGQYSDEGSNCYFDFD